MKTTLLSLTTLLLFSFIKLNAQVSNYTFTQSAVSYGSPNTGTIIGGTLQDDDVTAVTLPFPFIFSGTTYTTINVCANGYLSFNALTGFEYNSISNNSTKNVIAPFSQDIRMGTAINGDLTMGSNTIANCSSVTGFSIGDVISDYNSDFGGINPSVTAISGNNLVVNINATNNTSSYFVINMSGYIKYAVSGASPNRVCEFEFYKFTRFCFDETFSFKVRLYETSNKIEFVYRTAIAGNDVTPSEVGLKGNSNSDFNSRKVNTNNNWSNSLASTAITDACDFSGMLVPSLGQSYRWAPVTCVAPNLTVTLSHGAICKGQSAVLTASGATTYTWSTGSNSAQISVTPTTTTTYTISGANETCVTSWTIGLDVFDCTGISTIEAGSNEFLVYPNPFKQTLNVNNTGSSDMAFIIRDAIGRIIFSSKINADAHEIIQTEFLDKGLYFITLSDGHSSASKKIIKE